MEPTSGRSRTWRASAPVPSWIPDRRRSLLERTPSVPIKLVVLSSRRDFAKHVVVCSGIRFGLFYPCAPTRSASGINCSALFRRVYLSRARLQAVSSQKVFWLLSAVSSSAVQFVESHQADGPYLACRPFLFDDSPFYSSAFYSHFPRLRFQLCPPPQRLQILILYTFSPDLQTFLSISLLFKLCRS